MSWLFGLRKDPVPDISSTTGNLNVGSGSSGEGQGGSNRGPDESENKKSMDSYRFDSSALERAAKAARELELSPHAKEYLALVKLQEQNAMLEKQTKIKEFEAHIENAKSEQIRVQQEERRKTIAEETKHNQMRAQYQDQLARKRYDEQLLQQQRVNEENLRRQEESVAKQEAMRRETLAKEMDFRHQIDLKKIEAEVKAKAKADRENQDLILEQIRTRAIERRTTILESIKTAGSTVGAGINDFLSDWRKVTTSVAGITLVTLGYYSMKHGTGILARFIEARIRTPPLVQETSRLTLTEALKHPIKIKQRLLAKPKDVLQGVILNPTLEERLSKITVATRNTKKNKGVYRNLMLFGPPGTGKTLFVKRLAQHCGMDYAIMSGGEVVALGKDAVTAVHKVFNWANASRKGLLLFVDEAEAFLHKRAAGTDFDQNVRSALTAFFYRTGDQSDKVMLVLSTNAPEEMDFAMHNRIDESVHFKLPGLAERERMIRYYFDKYILMEAAEGKRKFKLDKFDYSKVCSEVAKLTEGFAGRQIVKLASAWQFAAYTSDDGVLTEDMIMKEVHRAVEEKKYKSSWEAEEESKKQVIDTSGPETSQYQGSPS